MGKHENNEKILKLSWNKLKLVESGSISLPNKKQKLETNRRIWLKKDHDIIGWCHNEIRNMNSFHLGIRLVNCGLYYIFLVGHVGEWSEFLPIVVTTKSMSHLVPTYCNSKLLKSMDWFCWENLNRKPSIFPFFIWGFPVKLPLNQSLHGG